MCPTEAIPFLLAAKDTLTLLSWCTKSKHELERLNRQIHFILGSRTQADHITMCLYAVFLLNEFFFMLPVRNCKWLATPSLLNKKINSI